LYEVEVTIVTRGFDSRRLHHDNLGSPRNPHVRWYSSGNVSGLSWWGRFGFDYDRRWCRQPKGDFLV